MQYCCCTEKGLLGRIGAGSDNAIAWGGTGPGLLLSADFHTNGDNTAGSHPPTTANKQHNDDILSALNSISPAAPASQDAHCVRRIIRN